MQRPPQAIDTVRAGGRPPLALDAEAAAALTGPDTIDCIAPAGHWQQFSSDAMAAKRRKAAWLHDTAEAAA